MKKKTKIIIGVVAGILVLGAIANGGKSNNSSTSKTVESEVSSETVNNAVESEVPVKAGVTICNTQYPWKDKAGGYGIQEAFGTKYIKKIDGDYNNVVGLPASRLYQELVKLGLI